MTIAFKLAGGGTDCGRRRVLGLMVAESYRLANANCGMDHGAHILQTEISLAIPVWDRRCAVPGWPREARRLGHARAAELLSTESPEGWRVPAAAPGAPANRGMRLTPWWYWDVAWAHRTPPTRRGISAWLSEARRPRAKAEDVARTTAGLVVNGLPALRNAHPSACKGGPGSGLDLVLRIAGVGILVSVLCTILKQQGKEEYSLLVATAGLIVVFLMLVQHIDELLSSVRSVFQLW